MKFVNNCKKDTLSFASGARFRIALALRGHFADFRTVSNSKVHSSITLCEQIEYCQNQQQWFSDYVKDDYEPFSLIGKFKTFESAEAAANKARLALGITFKGFKDPKKYLANIKEKLEENLILVSISKVLKNTTTRLQLSEFRGFALTDSYAPFVFINGNDALSAQIFTLCHELGHICLGLSGVSDVSSKNKAVPEIWCNEFAANFLMPKEEFSNDFKNADFLDDFIEFAKGKYFVSSLAILIRLYNLNLISKECFNESFAKAKAQYQKLLSSKLENKESSGGNYYRTVGSRLSALLTRTLIDATSVGKTTFRDATYLLGLGAVSVFDKLAKRY